MFKKNLTLIMIVILLILGSISTGFAEQPDQTRIKVNIKVSVMQRLEVVEPVAITFKYPWAGAENGTPLLIEDAGSVEVNSNVDWVLNVNALSNHDYNIYVRPAGKAYAPWLEVGSLPRSYSGSWGIHVISWDIKIEPVNLSHVAQEREETVELGFTLSRL
jgi:hypothetical protein